MHKYQYYPKKPRGEIVKDILYWLMVGGMIAVASTSPTFLYGILCSYVKHKNYKKQSVRNAFYRLQKKGALLTQKHNHQLYISLTEEGKRMAGRFQIDSLRIAKPKKWDEKWRLVIFDIDDREKIKREAFRGFLKRLQFSQLQKSIWIHPFDCSGEIALLKDFFGFTTKELRLIIAEKIENEGPLRKIFHLDR